MATHPSTILAQSHSTSEVLWDAVKYWYNRTLEMCLVLLAGHHKPTTTLFHYQAWDGLHISRTYVGKVKNQSNIFLKTVFLSREVNSPEPNNKLGLCQVGDHPPTAIISQSCLPLEFLWDRLSDGIITLMRYDQF